MGPDGTVYVADAGRKAVVALPPGGAPRALAEGQLAEPSAVAVLPDGNLIVVDAGASAIYRLSADGRLGERLAPEQPMYSPRGSGAAADGRLVVADTGNNRLLLLAPDGSAQTVGDLKEPTDAAFLPDGSLLVAETGADQLTIIKPDGQRATSWPMPHANTVVGPHVAVLTGGGWVATAPEIRSVLRMPPNGGSLEIWAAEPDWRKPSGVAAGPSGVAVTDAGAASALLLNLP
jgi:DNA-binding beta-propeller fold protein YncE